MRQFSYVAGLCLAFNILTAPNGSAREAVIGFSPHQNADDLKAQVTMTVHHLAKTVEPGETAYLFDAANLRLIASFVVPDKAAYANPRAKLQVNKKALRALKGFIDTGEPAPGRIGHIDLPAFLKTIRAHYPAKSGADLIILGSPIHHVAQVPSFSMTDGKVPNDTHIASDLEKSVYGTRGLAGSLEGYTAYFGVIGSDWSVSPQHAHRVERFWSLSVAGHGGSLGYFGADLATLFGLAGRHREAVTSIDTLAPTDKLEMLSFAPETAVADDIHLRPVETAAAPEPIWRTADTITVGATWACRKCDIDLYVRPGPSAETISYSNAETSGGRLYKDFVNSPRTGFETVELNGTVDLSKVFLALNFYAGKSQGGVTGQIRIAIGEQVWAAPFVIAARKGNQGLGASEVVEEQRAVNDAWILIDPVSIVTGE